jgi:uncharacterized membrane protein
VTADSGPLPTARRVIRLKDTYHPVLSSGALLNSTLKKAGKAVPRVFLRGLVVILPAVLTIALVVWLATSAEEFLEGVIRHLAPGWKYWPGLGILLGIAVIFAAGILVHEPVTRWLLGRVDALMRRIPLVKSIYLSIRDVAGYMSQDEASGFKQVVAVRVQDMLLIGFVTTEDVQGLPAAAEGEKLIAVYLPMSYGIGGYTVYLPKTRVEPLDMSLEDAMRLTLIGGVTAKEAPRT